MPNLEIGGPLKYRWCNLERFDGEVLDENEPHVAFEMRSADGLDEALAETKARAVISRIVEGAETAEAYGLESVDWADAVKAGDVPLFTGVGYIVFAVELAMICARSMRGVVHVETGEPVEWTRKNVTAVLRARRDGAEPLQGLQRVGSTYADTFMTLAVSAVRAARAEGKS